MTATLESIAEKIRHGELDKARQALQAAEKNRDDPAEVTYWKGCVLEAEHNRAAALDAFLKVIELKPDHTRALFKAGWLCDLAGDDATAMEMYRRCTVRDPAPVNALVNLALLYEEHGMLAEAEACLKNVIMGNPNHFRARHFLRSVASGYTMVYDERSLKEREQRSAILDMPISDFELSVRSRNCLRQMNIRTLGDLLRTTEAELLAYKNFGETSLNEIKALLASRGMQLGQGVPEPMEAPPEPVAVPAPVARVSTDTMIHLHRPVAELELSVRSRKALQRLGVATIGDLTMRSEAELMAIKNFGQTSLNEIKRQLASVGLSLRP
jgi:DNA-directed RNA polymerase subunit alpha